MPNKRQCCLCPSRVIERFLHVGDRDLYLCPLHSHLDEEVVKLAVEQTHKHPPKQKQRA